MAGLNPPLISADKAFGAVWNLCANAESEVTEKTPHLLVVDDNEMNRDVLSRRLSRQGYQVTTVTGGEDALGAIAAESFDLVLLDFQMPDVSGLDVLQALRKRYSAVDLPVIMVTSRSASEDIVQALDLGANDYVTKPVDFPVALARIRTQLSLKQAEEARRESEERYALALAGSNDGIWDWNLKTGQISFSTRWKLSVGYADEEIGSDPEDWFSRIHPEDRARVEADLKAHIDGSDTHFENEHRLRHRDGSYRWILSRGVAVRDRDGVAVRIAGSQTDITAGKVADVLTGLPNRVLFMDRLARLVERARRRKDHLFAILFLDLDQFKLVNDSLGHWAGDQLLVAFAHRLQQELRSSDSVARISDAHTLARFGGDEFTILLDDLHLPADALRVANRLLDCMRKPFHISGRDIFTTASIGVALSSSDYEGPEDLLRAADTAMYRAKASRRGSVEIFDQEMRASAAARLQLETELVQAASRAEFINWYQLIVDLESGDVRGFEALARWRQPSRGLILPNDFISVAEETGIIVSIGRQVLKEACRQLWTWQQLYPSEPPLTVSVNLSRRQFMQPDLITQIREEIESSGISASSLQMEITETMIMANPEQARMCMQELKSLGVRISMDDFGTGYSSLGHLHSFPLDVLKIDKSFVSRMELDRDKFEIVKTVISLAHSMGIQVVAEGVERPEHLALLRNLGCEFGQGYLFSRPLDSAASTDLLSSKPRWPNPGNDFPSTSIPLIALNSSRV